MIVEESKFFDKYERAVCIASGPSLTQEQIEYVRNKHNSKTLVICVNDNYKLYPECDILFALDIKWWYRNYEIALEMCSNDTQFYSINGNIDNLRKRMKDKYTKVIQGLQYVKSFNQQEKCFVHHAGNSGFVAVDLAYKLNCKKIILLGYDHKYDDQGKRHWFGDHDMSYYTKNADHIDMWQQRFELLAYKIQKDNVDLVNCSLDTALKQPRRSRIEQEL